MEIRRLGKSDLRITKVGVGTAPIGSTPEWNIYWGPQDEEVAITSIRTAIDIGVNWIDTAPFYGWGRAEQIVGKTIKGRRDQVHIFTKCGTLPDGKGGWSERLKPESIRRELRESLQRLQTDYVDLYQFHEIGVLGWGSLSEGVLADSFDIDKLDPKDFRRHQPYAQLENQVKVHKIREVFGANRENA